MESLTIKKENLRYWLRCQYLFYRNLAKRPSPLGQRADCIEDIYHDFCDGLFLWLIYVDPSN